MREGLSKILVTGAAGFIGSAFARLLLNRDCSAGTVPEGDCPKQYNLKGLSLIVIDKLTYAGDLARLKEVKGRYKFYKADICSKRQMESIFAKEKPQIVANFAAETHVDRSILDSVPFIETNITGTQVLLDASRKYGISKVIHISTDEIYGDIPQGEFLENTTLNPSSPYSASKAAADLLVKSYIRTFKFPAIIVRPSNNYGPWQYPEKLIPLAVLKILRGEKVPVYAKGENVREWLYVEDCASGVLQIMEKAKAGEIYNLGSGQEKQNIEVVKAILSIMKADESRIEFVKDRPGHDIRYKLNSQKVQREIGWQPKVQFEEGIRRTVEWCLSNKKWLLARWSKIAPLYKK
jgi:dTDP-glucose 4,6-dehydratase